MFILEEAGAEGVCCCLRFGSVSKVRNLFNCRFIFTSNFDGSHLTNQMYLFLAHLVPHVSLGGYFVE